MIVRGPKLFPWQSIVVDRIKAAGPNAEKIFVVKSKRQVGKSFLCMCELVRHSLDTPNSKSIMVSLTYKNCSKTFKELAQLLDKAPFITNINNSDMTISFRNNSMIQFKSAQTGDRLHGDTVTHGGILILDECSFMSDDIFGILFPYVNFYKCNILMVSTPFLKQGEFYKYYQEGLSGENPLVESIDLASYDTSAVLSSNKIEMYRKLLPEAQFISEILGEFVDEGGGVFKIKNNIWKLSKELFVDPSKYNDLFIGIDWSVGNGGDYTVISGFDSYGTQQLLQYTNNMTPNEIVDWISNIIKKIPSIKIKSFICEQNSIGNVYIDMLRKKLPNIEITSFNTSNSSKREIIEYMISRINDESLKFIPDEEQKRQFAAYQMEITSSGAITYNGAQGTHDDCVMASAIALKGIKDLQKTKYIISF